MQGDWADLLALSTDMFLTYVRLQMEQFLITWLGEEHVQACGSHSLWEESSAYQDHSLSQTQYWVGLR